MKRGMFLVAGLLLGFLLGSIKSCKTDNVTKEKIEYVKKDAVLISKIETIKANLGVLKVSNIEKSISYSETYKTLPDSIKNAPILILANELIALKDSIIEEQIELVDVLTQSIELKDEHIGKQDELITENIDVKEDLTKLKKKQFKRVTASFISGVVVGAVTSVILIFK